MGICATRLPTPRELIMDWREGMEGNLKDILCRVVVWCLGRSIQFLKDS